MSEQTGQGGANTNVQEALKEFLEKNPTAKLEEVDIAGERQIRVVTPWGDTSFALNIPPEPDKFIEALNAVYLPERYSALWHRDSRDLEIIFTAFPLGNDLADLPGRRFTFKHGSKEYVCEYGSSSDRLVEIAAGFHPIAQTVTQFRNLPPFSLLSAAHDQDRHMMPKLGEPLSFWIRDVEWDDDAILTLVNELNFYMTYFDHRSPTIVIHSPKLESFVNQPQVRYREGGFPATIRSRDLDDNMLRYWGATRTGDPASRFLYGFRIIEYASVFYLDAGSRMAVRRLLSAPNALDDMGKLTEGVLAALQEANIDAVQKFDSIIKETVSPEKLWDELSRNLAAFNTRTVFDGGFTIDPIAKDIQSAKQFGLNGVTAFSKKIREIRNALSHGRDQRTTLPVTPTSHNLERLQPWASVVAFVAGEIILYPLS